MPKKGCSSLVQRDINYKREKKFSNTAENSAHTNAGPVGHLECHHECLIWASGWMLTRGLNMHVRSVTDHTLN